MSRYILLAVSLGVVLTCGSCHRRSHTSARSHPRRSGKIVEATWYNVPEDSLARRRAGDAELTAASDHLKIGTLVRVTRVSNGRSVVVRITDTGLDATAARIDVCKEAAEQLDMVNDGIAKVRLQVLPPNARAGATLAKP